MITTTEEITGEDKTGGTIETIEIIEMEEETKEGTEDLIDVIWSIDYPFYVFIHLYPSILIDNS